MDNGCHTGQEGDMLKCESGADNEQREVRRAGNGHVKMCQDWQHYIMGHCRTDTGYGSDMI